MVMQLKTCCCGCSLRTGTVIIGVLSAIGATIGLTLSIKIASFGTGQLQKELIQDLEKERDVNPDADKAIKDLETTGTSPALSAVFICMAIISAVQLILAIMLVFGASAERPRLIKPWIVYSIVSMVLQTLLSVVVIFSGSTTNGALNFVSLIVGLALGTYFLLVVNSFHKELLSNNFQNKV